MIQPESLRSGSTLRGVWSVGSQESEIAVNHLMIGIGVFSFVVVCIIALFAASRNTETECIGCGTTYFVSDSDAEVPELFHNKDCQQDWEHWHPNDEFQPVVRSNGRE